MISIFLGWVLATVGMWGISDEELAAQLSSETHRFIPYLAVDLGAKVAQVPVTDLKRQSGKSKYTALGRLPRVLLDFLLSK